MKTNASCCFFKPSLNELVFHAFVERNIYMRVCFRYWIIPDITQAIFKEVIFDILEPCRLIKINRFVYECLGQ